MAIPSTKENPKAVSLMNLSNEARRYMLHEYLRMISHLSDKAYQIRIWIRNEGPECQAFDDAVCDFFDIGDRILNKHKEFEISEIQFSLLKNLRDEFEKFSDVHDLPQLFIDTPEWIKITLMAKKVLEVFNYQN